MELVTARLIFRWLDGNVDNLVVPFTKQVFLLHLEVVAVTNVVAVIIQGFAAVFRLEQGFAWSLDIGFELDRVEDASEIRA